MKGIPIGQHQASGGGRRKLGSRIAIDAAREGANFLSTDIFGQTLLDMSYREPGALVDLERLWSNMLSSMPLAFNLIAPLKTDKKLARRVFNQPHTRQSTAGEAVAKANSKRGPPRSVPPIGPKRKRGRRNRRAVL